MEYAKWHLIISTALSVAAIVHSWWNTRERVIKARFAAFEKQKVEAEQKELAAAKAEREKLTATIGTLGEKVAMLAARVENLPNSSCSKHAELAARQEGQAKDFISYQLLLTRVETDLKHLPTVRDIEALYKKMDLFREQVANLQSEVSEIAGAMPSLTNVTAMMNNYLLDHGVKQ
ncbi:hypothetical protein L4X63_09345 [Geomonas sp. Red32]|uniref:hypothetical protein n=1 Tax=Geomonas sp. Red32 TaxID=2912856 RepID=UPI00202D03B6|nr:hypothetical protein [Geomonas sp. Red32]MCM0081793.1 hypothetical protein [Geomonas sp. Red32]